MKNYVKPAISFQFFNLSSNVAGGCVMSANLNTTPCVIRVPDWPGDYLLAEETAGCTIPTDPGELCYGVPTGDDRVLGS